MRDQRRTAEQILVAAALLATLAGCHVGSDMNGPEHGGAVSLQSISPANGMNGVAITMPMTMRFSGAMGMNMERYVALHEGTLSGAVVPGRWTWSADRRTLTFTPDTPLRARTNYIIHMGGGLQGGNGMPVDYASCAALGGRGATGAMMGGATGMMGDGWKGADGGYGMIFSFTTG